MLVSCCCDAKVEVMSAGCIATYHCMKCWRPARTRLGKDSQKGDQTDGNRTARENEERIAER